MNNYNGAYSFGARRMSWTGNRFVHNRVYGFDPHTGSSGFLVRGNYAAVPRIVASKGFSFATVSASYAQFSNSGVKTYGGALDVPILRGTLVIPEIAVRGSYATMTGVDVLKLKTYGLEAFISKGFGPLMPYGAVGRMRTDSRGTISPTVSLHDTSNIMRYTVGLRLSMLIPKFVIEATQAEQRSYAAKISVGF